MGVLQKAYTWYNNIIDKKPCNVEFSKRFLSYVIDWGLGGVFSGLPAVFTYGIITGKSDMFSDLYIFPALGYDKIWAYVAGIGSLLFALFYYVYVPWKIYPGQTLGKRLTNYRIVKLDGSSVDLKTLMIRQVVGLFLLESIAFVVSGYIRQMVTLTCMVYVDYVWSIIGTVLCILSAMLVGGTPSHRALHDYMAKTKVELYDKNKPQKKEVKKESNEIKEQPKKEKAHRQTKQQGKKQHNRLPKKKKS